MATSLPLPTPDTATLLNQAQVAYHSLMTGGMARVVVDQNGERVEFTAARKADLYAYIQELQGQLAPVTRINRPMGFTF
jgi:phosphopantetheine adenylyltransferase